MKTGSAHQFDFDRRWRGLCLPHLFHPDVQALAHAGFRDLAHAINAERRRRGEVALRYVANVTPPALFGVGQAVGQRVSRDPRRLSFWRAMGCCQFVAPLALGLARRIRPNREWLVIRGPHHTVVTDAGRTIVFDLLLSSVFTARASLLFAGAPPATPIERRWLKRILKNHGLDADGRPVRLTGVGPS